MDYAWYYSGGILVMGKLLKELTLEFVRSTLVSYLTAHDCNVAATARDLGVSTRTLWRLIKELKITIHSENHAE